MTMARYLTVAIGLALTFVVAANADRLILKDGTVYEGRVLQQGEKSIIRLNTGVSKTVSSSDLATVLIDPITAAAKTPQAELDAVKRKADNLDCPVASALLWMAFIENHPGPLADTANREMLAWKKLADLEAEKIEGKWIGGDERKAILGRAGALQQEAKALMAVKSNLEATQKFKDVLDVYPNSYPVLFDLGMLAAGARQYDAARVYFEHALKIRPTSAGAMNNLGVVLGQKKEADLALQWFFRAAREQPQEAIARNTGKALAMLPPERRSGSELKAGTELFHDMVGRYNLDLNGNFKGDDWFMNDLFNDEPVEGSEPNAAIMSGSGFIISPDGLVLTSRHLVDHVDTLMVVTNIGHRRVAHVVAVSVDSDLALVRFKGDGAIPVLQLSAAPAPKAGTNVFLAGKAAANNTWPKSLLGHMSTSNKLLPEGDMALEKRMGHTQSGGPILDVFGQVVGIATIRGFPSSYEEGAVTPAISTAKINAFLQHNKVVIAGVNPGKTLTQNEIGTKVMPALIAIVGIR